MNAMPASKYIAAAIFIVFVLMVVSGALLAVISHRIIRSVCGLALCCFGLAGMYYFLHSPFLALMEILIYVGAVCITIVFAVMLAEPDETPTAKISSRWLWGSCAFAGCTAILWGVARLGLGWKWTLPEKVSDGSVKAIGISLLTTYSAAFELISLVLLVAILGALAIAREGRTKS